MPAFSLLCAYGYDIVEGPEPAPDDDPFALDGPTRESNGRLVRIGFAATENRQTWGATLRELEGVPLVVVADGHGAVKNALSDVWGRGRACAGTRRPQRSHSVNASARFSHPGIFRVRHGPL